MLKTDLKHLFLGTASRVTGRHAQLLPAEARSDEGLLQACSPYRIEGTDLAVEILEPGAGRLTAELLGYEGHFPTRLLWTGRDLPYAGPSALALDLATGAVRLGGTACGTAPMPLPGRRFCWRLQLDDEDGPSRCRLTGHYLAAQPHDIDRGYFLGENYVDHERESAGEAAQILSWLRGHRARGPVLEIGCATGGVLAAMAAAGLPAVGLDISPWAVEQVGKRLGPGHAWTCDVESDPLPDEALARGPFSTFVLSSVFEHFRDPFAVLDRLGRLAAPGAHLILHTTNGASLTHSLFGRDWEGYFDWSHFGVDRVSVETLAAELPRLGWTIEHLHTHLVWTVCADPTHATLREWYAADARFRRLIAEHDLGDLVLVVARRGGAPGPQGAGRAT